MIELRKIIKSKIGLSVFCAIAGSIAGSMVTVCLQGIYPKTPIVVMLPEKREVSEIGLMLSEKREVSKVDLLTKRPDFPSFIYNIQYLHEKKGFAYGLFNLQKAPPQWYYYLSFANLTRDTASNINLSFKSKKHIKYIFIQSHNCEISLRPSQKIEQDKLT